VTQGWLEGFEVECLDLTNDSPLMSELQVPLGKSIQAVTYRRGCSSEERLVGGESVSIAYPNPDGP